MTKKELNQVQKDFDRLFDRVFEDGFTSLSEEQRKEYWRLHKILVDVESSRIFYELIASGDYRT